MSWEQLGMWSLGFLGLLVAVPLVVGAVRANRQDRLIALQLYEAKEQFLRLKTQGKEWQEFIEAH